MIPAIFALGAVLIIFAGIGFFTALSLVPTDLGFTYMQASATLIGAGAIVLAIGLAARALDRRLAGVMSSSDAEKMTAPVPELPGDVSVGAMGVGAVTGAGSALVAAVPDAAALPGVRDDAEPDLFADLPQEVFLPQEALRQAQNSAPPVIPPSEVAEARLPDTLPDIPEPDLPVAIDLVALRQEIAAEDGGKDAPDENPAQDDETGMLPGAQPSEVNETAPGGLLPDPDLAGMDTRPLPPLAPIETLETVGAYDSGGMRFTMYSDGSVVASNSDGEQRFRSLEELRRHIGPARS